MTMKLTIARPDDWHLHVRDEEVLAAVVPHSAERFGRALIMPNLKPPVTTTDMACAYRERILAVVPAGMDFVPQMSLYLTDNMPPEEIDRAADSGIVVAAKLYPAGVTTNSDSGVTDVRNIYPVLQRMQARGILLCVHGEVTSPDIDIFDREHVFIEQVLAPLVRDFPELRVVFEHITTEAAVQFVRSREHNVGATITPHHLLLNRNAIFVGGIRPHHYCLPVLKRERHRRALVEAATSGDPRFFLGTDSAPHARGDKESACGCAGCYVAHAGIELYAEVFEAEKALEQLERFASLNGAAFYGLPPNPDTITLVRESWPVPETYPFVGGDVLVPLRAGEMLTWRLADREV